MIHVTVDQNRRGGLGGSDGRNLGGEILLGTLGASIEDLAAHEFGHVLTLEDQDDPNNLMSFAKRGGGRITRAQLEEAIRNCVSEKQGANKNDKKDADSNEP